MVRRCRPVCCSFPRCLRMVLPSVLAPYITDLMLQTHSHSLTQAHHTKSPSYSPLFKPLSSPALFAHELLQVCDTMRAAGVVARKGRDGHRDSAIPIQPSKRSITVITRRTLGKKLGG
eukprot:scaffold18812_cov37-Tisochrysis_lutea.AAC.3